MYGVRQEMLQAWLGWCLPHAALCHECRNYRCLALNPVCMEPWLLPALLALGTHTCLSLSQIAQAQLFLHRELVAGLPPWCTHSAEPD